MPWAGHFRSTPVRSRPHPTVLTGAPVTANPHVSRIVAGHRVASISLTRKRPKVQILPAPTTNPLAARLISRFERGESEPNQNPCYQPMSALVEMRPNGRYGPADLAPFGPFIAW